MPFREEMAKRHLKVTGDLGRVVFVVSRFLVCSSPSWQAIDFRILQEYDLYNTQSIEESVRHSDVVYNLVGRNYPTKYVLPLQGPRFKDL